MAPFITIRETQMGNIKKRRRDIEMSCRRRRFNISIIWLEILIKMYERGGGSVYIIGSPPNRRSEISDLSHRINIP
jgi:hypothetical protein